MKKRIAVFIFSVTVVSIIASGCIKPDSASWQDVHGAGCQRSDPKSGSLSDYGYADYGYYNELAPQGDAVRINNYVRIVRDTTGTGTYNIVDTNQTTYYGDTESITAPSTSSDSYYGQDAQFSGNQPSYTVSGDSKTVLDNITGLTWMKGPNTSLSSPAATDKMSYKAALTYVSTVNAQSYGGYSDWRLPTIKELYSLTQFSGQDLSGYDGTDTSTVVPFIDNTAFNFAYGQTSANERLIDSQYLSSNLYIGNTTMVFGVNFADGRIKGYGLTLFGNAKTFFVQLVRGNTSYGIYSFTDNGDQTVTDSATGLMWAKNDSDSGMNWAAALAWVQTKNSENYLGYSDWRLPNAKEMQSIVDYTHAPDYDGKPAIDTTYFNCTSITNEKNEADYPWYWTGTTHATLETTGSGSAAAYVTFGRAMGYSE